MYRCEDGGRDEVLKININNMGVEVDMEREGVASTSTPSPGWKQRPSHQQQRKIHPELSYQRYQIYSPICNGHSDDPDQNHMIGCGQKYRNHHQIFAQSVTCQP